MNAPLRREQVERFAGLTAEINRRKHLRQCETLIGFVRTFWHILEPVTPLVEGWVLNAICKHLEAVTRGDITRLLINVPPGSMKSLLVNVFWPAWEWGPADLPHLRIVNFSYAAHLTERDNSRFKAVVTSPLYRDLFGSRFRVTKAGEVKVGTDKTGWKLASSVGGISTGERGDRVILDDPHNAKQGESDVIRTGTVEWFGRSMSNRLNDMSLSAIIVIMQRLHESDVSGHIIASKDTGYVHLCIPAEFDPERACVTYVKGKEFWRDPRTKEKENFWPERFTPQVLFRQRIELGPFGYSGQYQQRPEPLGGGVIKRKWWKDWDATEARKLGIPLNDNGKAPYPDFSYIVASLDGAYTEKDRNDPSALTVWGVWSDAYGNPRIMLMYAWAERLEVNELVGKVSDACKRFRVSRILIENKASGHSVAQELRRMHRNVGAELVRTGKMTTDRTKKGFGEFAVTLVDPKKFGDKTARAYAVQPLFAAGLIYAPLDRPWAEKVIAECALFPKAAHDDLVDSTSQALIHLRSISVAVMPEEAADEMFLSQQFKPEPAPLYPV